VNVTVHIPVPLCDAFEGRRKLELGVPPQAYLGDVLQTLFSLYPGVWHLLAHEGPAARLQLGLLTEPRAELRMREGQRLFLTADMPRRLAGVH
jgi:hypothetical protein